jgi:hypothetical protein
MTPVDSDLAVPQDGRMRENDDDSGDPGTPVGDLADGLGETSEPALSDADPYGDTYGDDTFGEGDDGDDTSGEGDSTYGDGDGADGGVLVEEETDVDLDDTTATSDDDAGGLDIAATDPEPEASDPLEGIGFLLDELHDALFGEDDADPLATLAAEAEAEAALGPADVPTDTDHDFNGDGVVDQADLHDVVSQFDLGGDEGPHGA